ncbi:MAG TPA: RNA polymerase sigma-70 factor [Streptomyces sp.]
MTTALAEEFETHRPRLFGLAYRMLGSAEEAEDTVQDVYLRFSAADRAGIEHAGAWLAKVATNLCLNRLTSARARRERYVGPWLPEPVITSEGALGPLETAEQRDAVSLALLVLLERLTPTERAVYVLREAFAYGHAEIAGVLDITEANSRQLYRRAERRIAEERARFEPDAERRTSLLTAFLAAAQEGDLAGLEKLLAADVTWWGDGGGRVSATMRPVLGREKVARFTDGIFRRHLTGKTFTLAEVNGGPGALFWDGDVVVCAVGFECRDGLVTEVRAVLNPEKLAFLRRQVAV